MSGPVCSLQKGLLYSFYAIGYTTISKKPDITGITVSNITKWLKANGNVANMEPEETLRWIHNGLQIED